MTATTEKPGETEKCEASECSDLLYCPSCKFTEEEFKAFAERMLNSRFHHVEKKEDMWPFIYKSRFLNRWVVECRNCGFEAVFNQDTEAENIMLWNELPRAI